MNIHGNFPYHITNGATGQTQGPGSEILEALADQFQTAANVGASASLVAEHPRAGSTPPTPLGQAPFGLQEQHGHHGHHGHRGLGAREASRSHGLLSRIHDALDSTLNATQQTTDVTTSDTTNATTSSTTDSATNPATVANAASTSGAAAKALDSVQSTTAALTTLPQGTGGSFTVLSSLNAMVDALKNA